MGIFRASVSDMFAVGLVRAQTLFKFGNYSPSFRANADRGRRADQKDPLARDINPERDQIFKAYRTETR